MALCAKLLAEGVTVYAVTHPGSARAALLPQDARLHVVPCDAAELAALPELIPEKADAFFHFAWAHTIGPGRNDMPAQIENIRYTIAACRAAAQLGCQVFIGAGSQAEYGRVEGVLTAQTPCFPENGYGMAKLCAGQMSRVECQTLGVAHIWTRILSVYGPHDGPATMISGTIRKLLHGEKPALTAGIQQWDYLYAADAAAAFYALAVSGQDGRVYPLGSGTARPLKDYIVAGVAATIFLGGWMPLHISGWEGFNAAMDYIPGFVWFFGKAFFVVWLLMWIKWTFPRLRIDQILTLEWKYLVPIGLANLLLMVVVVVFKLHF